MKASSALTRAAILLAIGIWLPTVFHMVGQGGAIWLPMHWSILLGGYYLPIGYAVLLGFLTPALSALITGMPPAPLHYFIMLELGALGGTIAWLRRKNPEAIYGPLLAGMLASRVFRLVGSLAGVMFFSLPLSMKDVMFSVFVLALPGIALQWLLLPLLVRRLRQHRLD